ncbi:hypothetical protein LCGC14_2400820 [marine sediment metagenome]|uniref:Uncharacterized protein n=1 Tax=marine sediment metagenome TaxID=412755 RepID=A0A0F9BVD1_9ZZZZ
MKLREFRHYWRNLKHPSGPMSLGLGDNQCIGYSSIYGWWIADVTWQNTRRNITNIESKEAVKLLVGVIS